MLKFNKIDFIDLFDYNVMILNSVFVKIGCIILFEVYFEVLFFCCFFIRNT